MFGKRKKQADEELLNTSVDSSEPGKEITILVTEEDKTGSDVTKMSDFFSIAVQEMSKELVSSAGIINVDEIPASDLSIVNNAIQTVGVFRSPAFDLVPDFASLPNDIKKKYKAGELILGESKQVDGNIRSVLIDAKTKTKTRVKDVTLKKVEHTDISSELSRDILTQMQLRQISEKLDCMIAEQSYLIDFTRNQAILRPFLDARDSLLKAQGPVSLAEQRQYLLKASDSLQSAINAVYVDMNTIEGHLAVEAKKKWYQRINRKSVDNQISRLTADTLIVTKYVGMQTQVYHYLEDTTSAKNTLDIYRGNINRFFQKGIVSPDKSLALFIHENVEYNEKNMDCWYHMEEQIKPMLKSAYEQVETKAVYVISGSEVE